MGGVPVLLTRGMGERLTCRIRCHKILGPLLEWGPMGPHIINIMGPLSGFWGPL